MSIEYTYFIKEGEIIDLSRFPQPGERIRFTAQGGYDCEQVNAMKLLSLNDYYTVKHTRVGATSSTVELMELPGYSFNTCLFEDNRNVSS